MYDTCLFCFERWTVSKKGKTISGFNKASRHEGVWEVDTYLHVVLTSVLNVSEEFPAMLHGLTPQKTVMFIAFTCLN